MTKQTINIGSEANDGTGDPLRSALEKINDNFDEIYGAFSFSGNVATTSNTIIVGSNTAAANGHTFLPNGLKMVWGSLSVNSSSGTATFQSAFVTNAFSIQATSNTPVTTYQPAIISVNNTIASIRTSNVTSTKVFFMAIGI